MSDHRPGNAGVSPASAAARPPRPLAGVRVLDLGQIYQGPYAGLPSGPLDPSPALGRHREEVVAEWLGETLSQERSSP